MLDLWGWYTSLYNAGLTTLLVAAFCLVTFLCRLHEYEFVWQLLDIFHRYEPEEDDKSIESRRRKRYFSHLERSRLHPNRYKAVSPRKIRRLNRSSSLGAIRALSLSLTQALIWSVPVTLVVAFVVGALGLLVGPYDTETTRWQEETRIVAMADSLTTGVYGSVFLGTGSVSSEGVMTYAYAVEIPGENGRPDIQPRTLTHSNVRIRQMSDFTSGTLVSIGNQVRTISHERTWWYDQLEETSPIKYPADEFVFIVPEGTVRCTFEVDLQ